MLYDWLKAFFNLGKIARQHLRKQRDIMSALSDLQASSDLMMTHTETTVTLIRELRASILAATDDSAALVAIKAQLDAAMARLASA